MTLSSPRHAETALSLEGSLWKNSFWKALFEKLFLGGSFWKALFEKLFFECSFWKALFGKTLFGKLFLENSFWRTLFGILFLKCSFTLLQTVFRVMALPGTEWNAGLERASVGERPFLIGEGQTYGLSLRKGCFSRGRAVLVGEGTDRCKLEICLNPGHKIILGIAKAEMIFLWTFLNIPTFNWEHLHCLYFILWVN